MKSRPNCNRKHGKQYGFSMVEMLMAAFILAIGILGLTALQTMSLKSSTSSKGLTTGVLVAERVLDEIESNARNTLLYRRSFPPVTLPANLVDFLARPVTTYNFAGRPSVGDPIDPNPYFTVTTSMNPATGNGIVAPVTGLGGIAFMQVDVAWTEAPGTPARHVILSRRVAYATA